MLDQHFSIWATEDFRKKSIFTDCSVLTDFCHYLHLSLNLFYFWVLLRERAFWKFATVANALMDVLHMLELNPSGFVNLIALMLLMKIVWSFVWRKFSSVGREEWCDEMKDGQKLKLGDAHVTPRNIQEVQAPKLGDAPASPLHQQKYQVIFQCTIFLLIYMICAVLGASLFLFLFLVFFCFVCCNKWLDPIIHVLEETHSVLIARNTLVFTLISQRAFYFCEYYV